MSETSEAVYAAWAPATSKWSAWAKPVLFATLPRLADIVRPLPSIGVMAYEKKNTAVVVDLPSVSSTLMGLALAEAGFQPVPLYNGALGALGALVDSASIAEALAAGAAKLRALPPRENAAPAFLLDANRMDNSVNAKSPGRFDNRWAVVPQDMPSADFLKDAGLQRVVLIAGGVRDDLAHILHRYQDAGLEIRRTADPEQASEHITVARPIGYRSLWYRLGVFAGLRRNSAGGFGATVPIPSSSGGYG